MIIVIIWILVQLNAPWWAWVLFGFEVLFKLIKLIKVEVEE